MKRVNVKGTFVELDALHHGPSWYQPTAEEFSARVREEMDAMPDGWVIDGNYEGKLGSLVLDQADTIVWLDLPLALKLRRVLRRTVGRIRGDVELWSGNKETWRGVFWGRESLLWWTVKAHIQNKRHWPARFAGDPRLVRLRSVAEARRWLDTTS